MKVLIAGANGQLGRELQRYAPADVELHAWDRAQLDIGDEKQVTTRVRELRPDIVINAAAYTAVDKAEGDEAGAIRGNVEGPACLARAVADLGAGRMLHVSTDFVFDGAQTLPYRPADAPNPLGVYGRTKLAGERAVLECLRERATIIRTAWVYAAHGHNFMRTMLRLMNERGVVRVVSDQVGTPTAAPILAQLMWRCAARNDVHGIYHWTDAGVASWYDFAVAIAEEAGALGMLEREVSVMPIATDEYPTPARRPAFSVLDKSQTYTALNIAQVHWRVRLREVLREISQSPPPRAGEG